MTDAMPLGHNRSWGVGAKGVQYTPQTSIQRGFRASSAKDISTRWEFR